MQLFRFKQRAYKQVFEEHFDYATQMVWNMIRNQDDTEDIVQQSFVKLFKSMHRFRQESSVKTYFTRILINTAMDFLRGKKAASLELNEAHLTLSPVAERSFDELLNCVTPQQRVCLSLHYNEDLKVQEISTLSGMSVGTVKSHLSRGRETIKAKLASKP